LPGVTVAELRSDVVVEIGGLPIRLRSDDPAFIRMIQDRYAGYVSSSDDASFEFDVELAPPGTESGDEDLRVTWDSGRWLMERGIFAPSGIPPRRADVSSRPSIPIRSIPSCVSCTRYSWPGRAASWCTRRAPSGMDAHSCFPASPGPERLPWQGWLLPTPRCLPMKFLM